MPNPTHREKAPLVQQVRTEVEKNPTFTTRFSSFAAATAGAVGSPYSFIAAIVIVLIWGITGPMFHYSDTWQLIINTGTTILTFIIVFLIQNTQNRDAKAIHLKLNELVHAMKGAHNELIDVEKLSDEELKRLEAHYDRIRKECARRRERMEEPEIPKPDAA